MGRTWAKRAPSLGDEDGIAVAITIMVMTVALALASVGSVAAMSSLRNSGRDSESKRAFAVAEAGAEQAMLRQNKILATDAFPCLVLGVAGSLIPGYPNGNGWCPPQEGTVEDGAYEYTVKPPTATGTLAGQQRITIVSEGTVGDTSRRIAVDAVASTGAPAFAEASVIGLDQFDIDGNGEVVGDVGTNADLVLGGNAKVCGNVTHGVGRGVQTSSNAEVCSGYTITEGTFSLSPPDPGDVATNNDNDRFFTLDPKVGNVTWDSSTRSLELSGNSALTLGGGNYSFCQLTMSGNSNIYIANGAVVRIYFDSPENCGQSGGVEQLSMTGNSEISATVGDASDVGMLFVGSSTTPTTVKLAGNGKANEVMIYAPRSDVKISGNGNYTGAIAGKTIVDTGNGTITAHASTLDFQVTVSTAYSREKLVECVGALTTSDPSNAC